MAKKIKVKGFPKPFTFDDDVTEEEIDRIVEEEIIPNREKILEEGMREDITKARQEAFGQMSGLEKFIAGTGRGLMDVYEGVGQLALEAGDAVGLVKPETVDEYTKNREAEREVWDDTATGFTQGAGRFTGGVLPFMAIPGGAVGGGLGKTLATGAAAGAAQGMTEFVPEDESRAGNVALGALFGLGGGALAHGGKKLYNAARGALERGEDVARAADNLGIPATAGDVSQKPGLRRVEQALEYIPFLGMTKYREKQAGAIKSVLEKTLQKYKDELPSVEYEHLKRVETKAKAGDKAAIRTMNEVVAAGDDPDKIIKASATLKLWRAREKAKGLYDRVERMAGDAQVPMAATKVAVKKGLLEAKNGLLKEPGVIRLLNEAQEGLKKKSNYGRARKMRSDLRDKIEQFERTGQFKEAAALKGLKEGIESDLQAFSAGFGKQRIVQHGLEKSHPEIVYHGTPSPFNSFGSGKSEGVFFSNKPQVAGIFSEVPEDFASELDNYAPSIKKMRLPKPDFVFDARGRDSMDPKVRAAMKKAKDSGAKVANIKNVRGFDTDEWAGRSNEYVVFDKSVIKPYYSEITSKVIPGLREAQDEADKFYATKLAPMRDYNRKFINKANADELTRKGLNARSEMASQKFYSSLDEKGRAAVRYNIVEDAWKKAYDSAKNTVSPTKFASHIQGLEKSTGFFFKGQDKQELDGLVKILRHLERAGHYAENPATGDRFTRLSVWAGLMGAGFASPKIAAAGYASAGIAKALLTTKMGRNLLLASSKLDPTKKEFDRFAAIVAERLPSIMTSAGMTPTRDTE